MDTGLKSFTVTLPNSWVTGGRLSTSRPQSRASRPMAAHSSDELDGMAMTSTSAPVAVATRARSARVPRTDTDRTRRLASRWSSSSRPTGYRSESSFNMASITRLPAVPAPNTSAGRRPSRELPAARSFSPAERSARRTPSCIKPASGPANSTAATWRRASVMSRVHSTRPSVVIVAARATRWTSSTEPARQALRYRPTAQPAAI